VILAAFQRMQPIIKNEIEPGSIDDHIIADWMEAGLGFRQTTCMVNGHRLDYGLAHIDRNFIMNAFQHMQPIITKVR